MFNLTSAAARQIQQAAAGSGAQDMALRVAAKALPDGSLDYGMGFDDAADDDMKLVIEGVAVLIAPAYQELLDATVLDFAEIEPGKFNFIFFDAQQADRAAAPGAGETGGCGSGACASGGCAGKGTRQ